MRLSGHAITRARQRLNLPKRELEKLAYKALIYGIVIDQVYGKLKKYIIKLYRNHRRRGKHIRVYEGIVFIFVGDMLLTVIDIPESIADYKQYIKDRKEDI